MRSLLLLFGVTFSAASVGLWLFPLGFGALAALWWTGAASGTMLVAGFVSGYVSRTLTAALGSSAGVLLGLASAWALTKILDPSRPEGELMVLWWAVAAVLVGGMHVAGVVLRTVRQDRAGVAR